MNLELEGKSALVCGASQGLGKAIAEALAAEGCRVGLLARSAAQLERNVADLKSKGLSAVACPADMSDWPSLASAIGEFGSPDILVNNSGGPPVTDVTVVDPPLWRSQFETLVLNQMRLTEAMLPAMRAAKFGRILTVSSTSIVEPLAGFAFSNALRAALANWMKTLSTEVAGDGVTVNVLLPGTFTTARVARLNAAKAARLGISTEALAAEQAAEIPARRFGDPREFAAVAAFLASPRASYVTGQMIRIDGGATHSV